MTKPNFHEEKRLWKKRYTLVIGVDEVGRGAFAGPVVAAAVAFWSPVVSLKKILEKNALNQSKNKLMKLFLLKQEKLRYFRSRATGRYFSQKISNFSQKMPIEQAGIADSKQLTSQKRQKLEKIIQKHCLFWAVAEVGVGTINRLGIGKATEKAMRKAVLKIREQCQLRLSGDKSPLSFNWQPMNPHLSISAALPAKIKEPKIAALPLLEKIFLLSDAFHVKYLAGIGLKNQKAIVKGDQKSISIAAASILAKVHRDRLMKRLSKRYPQYGWGRNKGYGTKEHQQAIRQYGASRFHRKQFLASWLKRQDSP